MSLRIIRYQVYQHGVDGCNRIINPLVCGDDLLGGDSGLRGYLPRHFDGDRRLTASVELRPVFLRHTDWALGGTLFADGGGAWDGSPSLHASFGAGLRLGLPRIYDTPVLRADVAHGLSGGVWQLSFGLGQYF